MGLYISASGILNAAQRQRVAANNIANLRTPGYRAARPHSSATASGGVRMDAVTRDNASGPVEWTGRPLDLAAGDAFFQVELPDGTLAYTRDGHFGRNADGKVVTSSGARLMPPVQVPPDAASVTVSSDGTVYALRPGDMQPQQAGRIAVFRFANTDGLEARGGNLFVPTAASGPAQAAAPETGITPGAVEGSDVNMVREQVAGTLNTRTAQANINAFRAQDDELGELLDLTQ